MVYRNSGSLGLVLWSCGLGKRDNGSLSLLYPSVFILFFPRLSFPFSLALSLYQTVVWKGLSSHFWCRFSSLFVGGPCCRSQRNCRKALHQAVFCVVGGGRDLLSDSNRKAFISSTCHDPGTALRAQFLYEHGQWKVWSLDRRADWFLAYGTNLSVGAAIVNMHILLRIKTPLFPHLRAVSWVFSFTSALLCASTNFPFLLCLSL